MTTSPRAGDREAGSTRREGRRALITGITGQDGMYLADLLLDKGYEVYGIMRRTSSFRPGPLERLARAHAEEPRRLTLFHGDMTNAASLVKIVEQVQPDEVYNLAAQSEVAYSFREPEYTADSDALGPLRLLEALRRAGLQDTTRFYQASTSELFGGTPLSPQSESTPFHPKSPYAVAKLYAYWITVNYREAYGMYACNGILFNHESPLRREAYVTRKITRAMARIALGLQDCVHLGNLDAKRDWGHARDYVEMQWLMLQQDAPEDYVIATGIQHSVREFADTAARHLGMALDWQGEGIDEIAVVRDPGPHGGARAGQVAVRVDPRYFRPADIDAVVGDPAKAHRRLGWTPRTSFDQLVADMVRADLEDSLATAQAPSLAAALQACNY